MPEHPVPAADPPRLATLMVRRLEQARLLTDPFKLRLLEGFADRPATTKQVADRFGEKAPRLYRHVDALVEAGLLELVAERPKRGTIERYYRTVAHRFEVDPALFRPAEPGGDDPFDVVRVLIRETEHDLVTLLAADGDLAAGDVELPVAIKVGIRATPAEVRQLKQKLMDLVASFADGGDDPGDRSGSESYTALLAFYPAVRRD